MSTRYAVEQAFIKTLAKVLDFIGINRELIICDEDHRIYVQDGVTRGGFPVAMVADPTLEVRGIPFKGPDPKAGETWVFGEWSSDADPLVKIPAYVAGAVGVDVPVMSDDDIAEGESEVPALPNAKQLGVLGRKRKLIWSGDAAFVNSEDSITYFNGDKLRITGTSVFDVTVRVGASVFEIASNIVVNNGASYVGNLIYVQGDFINGGQQMAIVRKTIGSSGYTITQNIKKIERLY